MIRRILAALVALVLAAVGAVLVLAYASSADERALEGLETVEVLVAKAAIEEGTGADQLTDLVELKPVPRDYVVAGTVDDLEDLEGRLLTTPLAAGEQLRAARFATPEELRSRDDFQLPEEAADLHQVTIPLDNARALGGNIAAGDTVGVFVSVETEDEEGGSGGEEGEKDTSKDGASMTHLTLHKVLVTRVAGGFVEPPAPLRESDDAESEESGGVTGGGQEQEGPADTIHVTLALEAPDAEKLVFGMEFGQVWLSLEPDGASEEGTGVVVVVNQQDVRDLWDADVRGMFE